MRLDTNLFVVVRKCYALSIVLCIVDVHSCQCGLCRVDEFQVFALFNEEIYRSRNITYRHPANFS